LRIQKKVGILPKDTSSGPFIDEWKKVYGNISKDVDEVDISAALSSAALAVKDENELVSLTNALGWATLICDKASYAK
jgi:nucleosome binding factor SPN SPT16 subunit